VEEGMQLGRWLHLQRHSMKKGKLLHGRKQKLEEIVVV